MKESEFLPTESSKDDGNHTWTEQEEAEYRAAWEARGVRPSSDPRGELTAAESDVIRREIREGTPDTPERVATIRRADEAFRKSFPSDSPTLRAALDAQEFYEVMQAYRFAPLVDQNAVVAAFDAVKDYVARAALGGAGQQEAPDDTRPGEAGTVTLGKPCARCGGTEYRCANCQDDAAERGDHTLSPEPCEHPNWLAPVWPGQPYVCESCGVARPQPPEEPSK